MRGLTRFAASVVLLFPLVADAQGSKPNFSGTWALDVERSDTSHRDAGPVTPVTMIIHQEEGSLRVETVRGDQRQDRRYSLDRPQTAAGRDSMLGTILRWDGGQLVTLTP